MSTNIQDLEDALKEFREEYGPKIRKRGFWLSGGIGKLENSGDYYIAALISQCPAKDSIAEDLFAEIRDKILPDTYKGFLVRVKYEGECKSLELS